MATVPQTQSSNKVYNAILDVAHGIVGKVNGQILFLHEESDELTVIEPEHFNFLVILGLVGLADSQQAMDRLRGGAVGVCLSRKQEAA